MSQDNFEPSNIPTLVNSKYQRRSNSPEFNNLSLSVGSNGEETPVFKTPDTTRKSRNNDGRLVRSSTIGSGSKSPIRRHLRTLSITSNNSTISNSNSNSSRKGINLGINLVGSSITNNNNISSNKNKDLNFRTPRRKLFSPASNNENKTNHLASPMMDLRDGAVDNSEHRSSMDDADVSLLSNSSPTPSSTLKIGGKLQDDLSENFRLLASKEMEILEIKNSLKELIQKKREKEFELQQLKINIEKQLMTNLKQQNNDQYKHKFDQHIPKSPISVQKRVIKPSNSSVDPLLDDSYIPIQQESPDRISNSEKRKSWFSKPLNFIQQFDNLIYKEFEKLQIPEDEEPELNSNANNIIEDYTSIENSNDTAEEYDFKEINAPIKSLAYETTAASSTDVMQSVSQHLWSFVNDVKSNLLIDESETNLSSTPLVESSKSDDSNNRLRTASISKRQSYGQHNIHKKRPSMNILKTEPETSSSSSKESIGQEFTKERISNVVQSISKKEDVSFESGKELKSGINNNTEALMDNYIEESDLWDNETLDI